MSKWKKRITIVIIVIAAYWLLRSLNIFPSLNIFASKPVVIDETPIVIKEIRSIGQLITYSSFDEVVMDSVAATRGSAFVNTVNRISPVTVLPSADKQLVLIGRGQVLVGTDLTLLSDSGVTIKGDTIILVLPAPQIFDAIVNPGGFETFIETGNWSMEEVTQVKTRIRKKMVERALRQNILQKAMAKSKATMESFLTAMGYKKVYIK